MAAGTDLLRRRELLLTLVERQLRLRLKRSVMGVAWPLAAPLFLLALYTFVFRSVFEVPIDDYPVYLFAALLPWTFLVQTVHDALQSISFEPELVRRAPFPHVFLPLARVVVMAIPFLALLAGFVVWLGVSGHLHVAALPALAVPVASLVLLVAGLATLLALVDVFNRDLRFVLHNLLTVWFFLVPIVYSPRMADGRLELLRAVDPMNLVVRDFRDVLYAGAVHADHLAVTAAVCTGCFLVALWVFRRLSADLAMAV